MPRPPFYCDQAPKKAKAPPPTLDRTPTRKLAQRQDFENDTGLWFGPELSVPDEFGFGFTHCSVSNESGLVFNASEESVVVVSANDWRWYAFSANLLLNTRGYKWILDASGDSHRHVKHDEAESSPNAGDDAGSSLIALPGRWRSTQAESMPYEVVKYT